jgi:hypothetical protein
VLWNPGGDAKSWLFYAQSARGPSPIDSLC